MKYIKNRVGLATAVILVLSLCSLSVANLVSLVQAAVPWTKYTGEVTLEFERSVVDSWVIKDGGTYKMWYTHSKSDMDIGGMVDSLTSILSSDIIGDLVNLNFNLLLDDLSGIDAATLWDFLNATSTVIGYAESSDGKVWTVVNDEVLAGDTGELENIGMPCVIKTVDGYEMWFTHSLTDLTQSELQNILTGLGGDTTARKTAILALLYEKSTAIGYTTSTNGTTWENINLDVLPSTGSGIWHSVASPCVIKNDTDDYEMWFTHAQISLTETELYDILADIINFGAEDLWTLLDDIQSTIGYATSTDGVDWGTPDYSVFTGGGTGLWNSVATPCVIKHSDTDYEMWYTHLTTDLNETSFTDLMNEIKALETDILGLIDTYTSEGLDAFLTALKSFLGDPDEDPPIIGDIDPILPYLANTSARIGYATSGDGEAWTEQDPTALTGSGGSPWSSVASPCVVYENGVYEMWYTQGVDYPSAQNFVSLMDGSILPIGYAYYEVSIDLVAGWNFIGLIRTPTSSSIEDVLADIISDVEIVWYYDAGTWYYFIPDGPQTLTEMTEGKGYWLETANTCKLIVDGVEPSLPYDIPLVVGWNLVSLPETPSPSTIEDVLADIIADVEIVWYYDGAMETWYYFIPDGPQNLIEMTEGKAYWIEMTAPNTLTIDNN